MSLRGRAGAALAEIGGLLLPSSCLGCGARIPLDAPDPLVCGACRGRLREPPWPRCPRCHLPLGTGRAPEPDCLACRAWPAALLRARWAVALEPPADALVHGLKYEGWRGLAGTMGDRMARLDPGWESDGSAPPPVVVPVPTTPARLRVRGYNQAALLARVVARRRGLRLVEALARRKGGGTQVALHPDARRANVSGAFRPTPEADAVRGRHVLLVDDVLTTGATAAEVARTLERAGSTGVVIVTFARSLPGRSSDGWTTPSAGGRS